MSLPQPGLDFLMDLAENNNKEWFQANKKRYERELKNPARALVEQVNAELEGFAPDHVTPAGKAINRINRDIRFSKDKTPYNTHLWAGFHNQTRPKGAGAAYYFGLSADSFGVGAGCWMPPPDRMQALREHIAEHHEQLASILAELEGTFQPLSGTAYKRVPKPWDADHPAAELLKFKGMHTRVELDPALATQPKAVAEIAKHLRLLKPLVDFLEDGLGRGL